MSPRAVKPKSVCISEEIDVEFDFPTRDASKLRAIFRVVPPGGVNFTVQWFNEKNQIIVAKGLDIPVISNVLDDGLIVIPIPKEARRGMYAIEPLGSRLDFYDRNLNTLGLVPLIKRLRDEGSDS